MLFTGEYEHTIDTKLRLAIPSELRARLEGSDHTNVFYLVPGPNGALWLWPEKTFELMASASKPSLLPAEEMMEFEELLFSQARRLEMDKTGRVRLPERMRREAQLGDAVAILGVRDHLELRDAEAWEQRRRQKLDKQVEIMLKARRALEEQQSSTNQDQS
ncbi:MAG: hypothetical protein O7G85_14870 [Planctomycetota bacterium]|nr:hypothetical protein [Planctomycetota bacterium]